MNKVNPFVWTVIWILGLGYPGSVIAQVQSNLTMNKYGITIDNLDSTTTNRWVYEFGQTQPGELNNDDDLELGWVLDAQLSTQFASSQKRFLLFDPDISGLFVNPGFGGMRINTGMYVDAAETTYAGYFENNQSTSQTRYGLASIANGTGVGVRYGLIAYAQNSSGTKYGVIGVATGASGSKYGVYASGDLVYTGALESFSDRKLKKDIKDFDALERILHLRPRTYTFRQDEFPGMSLKTGQQYGFIAQELEEVIPEMVRDIHHPNTYPSDTGMVTETMMIKGIQPMQLLPMLTRALQEEHDLLEEEQIINQRQNEELRHLKQENQALRNRLAELETKMEQVLGQQPGGDSDPVVLTSTRLDQNFPNPYDRETAIGLFIPESVQRAELRIINTEGRVMRTIVIGDRGETKQVLEAKALQAGSYFYSLVLDGTPFSTRQMLLLK